MKNSALLLLAIAAVAVVRVQAGSGASTGRAVSRIAVGSCNRQDDVHQPIFDSVRELKSDVFVWLGDAVYGDVRRIPFLWTGAPIPEKRRRWDQLKSRPDYVRLLKDVPGVIGNWDDHDYGLNNAGADYVDRVVAQEMFLDFLDEPSDSPRRKQEGIYAAYTYGAGKDTVKVILLDNRYNRDAPGADTADMLGERQWQWLESELASNTAAVTLIGSGIQVLPLEKPIQEKWAQFPASRDRLLQLIAKHRVSGVIFLSGDIHWAEMYRSECTPVSYPLYELTTSGMSHSAETQIPFAKYGAAQYAVSTLLNDSHRIAYYTHLNFATVDFDWKTRTVTLNLRRPNGEIQFFETIPLSRLQANPTAPVRALPYDAMACPPVSAWRNWAQSTFVYIIVLFAVAAFVWAAIFVRAIYRFAVRRRSSARPKAE